LFSRPAPTSAWSRIAGGCGSEFPDRFLAGRKGKDLPTSETDLHKSEAEWYFSLLARLPEFIAYGAAEPIGRATATGAPTADVFLDDKAT